MLQSERSLARFTGVGASVATALFAGAGLSKWASTNPTMQEMMSHVPTKVYDFIN